MPSRRQFLRGVGGTALLGTAAGSAAYLDLGFVRTKAGGGGTNTIDLASQDNEVFIPPENFDAYATQMHEQYGDATIPWTDPESLAGEFVGAYTRQETIVPTEQYAIQDATILAHRLGSRRYKIRLWSAGRLLGKKYDVDPWGLYQEETAFTWLEQEITVDYDEQLSADTAQSGSGRTSVAGGTVTVPDGSYEMGLSPVNEVNYRSRWEGFATTDVPLIGACEVQFETGTEPRLDWSLSYGVGIRTPF